MDLADESAPFHVGGVERVWASFSMNGEEWDNKSVISSSFLTLSVSTIRIPFPIMNPTLPFIYRFTDYNSVAAPVFVLEGIWFRRVS